MDIIAQILGIIGMLLGVFSLQCRKSRNFYLMAAASGFLFSVNYIMIGAFTGAIFNFLSIIRAYIFVDKKRCRVMKWLVLVCGLYIVSAVVIQVVLYQNILQLVLSVFTTFAMVVITYAMWTNEPNSIRWLTIFVSSPIWLVHNSINFTLGGLCSDIFHMISAIVFLIRVRNKKTEIA